MTTLNTTTGKMRVIHEALNSITMDPSTGTQRRLPAKLSYWIARVLTKLQSEYETSEKARLALAEELGTKTEDGQHFEFNAENAALFHSRFAEIQATELTLDLPTIRIDSLESVTIEPGVFMALEGLVID